ncbi:unnamed protein product [Pedinophyceae sp. YPF-701]|nr:unnamed protein product [Pedinophyceae sp. YPF-701]
MAQRVTYRRRHSYATRSNKTKMVKTPGGRLVVQYVKKPASHRVCPITGQKLNGFKAQRPKEGSTQSRSKKNVSRVYGGHLAASAVRERIVRAFLIEEQKIVKKVLREQAKLAK